jgi:hypothetical protein
MIGLGTIVTLTSILDDTHKQNLFFNNHTYNIPSFDRLFIYPLLFSWHQNIFLFRFGLAILNSYFGHVFGAIRICNNGLFCSNCFAISALSPFLTLFWLRLRFFW